MEGSHSYTCPKCAGTMRTYERNGIHLEQCTECRGMFLDRGELERLVEAEQSHYRGFEEQALPPQQRQAAPPPQPTYQGAPAPQPTYPPQPQYQQPHYGHGHGHGSHHYKKKKHKSFLSELLDFD